MKNVLEYYNEIGNKLAILLKKKFNGHLVHNKKLNQHKRRLSMCLCTSKVDWFNLKKR